MSYILARRQPRSLQTLGAWPVDGTSPFHYACGRGQFKLIGHEKKFPRLDSRAKSFGMQQFGIDVMLPDVIVPAVAEAIRAATGIRLRKLPFDLTAESANS